MRKWLVLFGALFISNSCASTGTTDTLDLNSRIQQELDFFWETPLGRGADGATICVGERASLITIRDYITSEDKLSYVVAHEAVHILQGYRLGCDKLREMVADPVGQILLEAEAYSLTGVKGEILIRVLKKYEGAQFLTDEEIRLIAAPYY